MEVEGEATRLRAADKAVMVARAAVAGNLELRMADPGELNRQR